ncbi:hypothetical protein R2F25_37350 [Streptomyces sp. UP1A-1]|nr:hypothetical protein [Streptomyces sp. UP1A-1]
MFRTGHRVRLEVAAKQHPALRRPPPGGRAPHGPPRRCPSLTPAAAAPRRRLTRRPGRRRPGGRPTGLSPSRSA